MTCEAFEHSSIRPHLATNLNARPARTNTIVIDIYEEKSYELTEEVYYERGKKNMPLTLSIQ